VKGNPPQAWRTDFDLSDENDESDWVNERHLIPASKLDQSGKPCKTGLIPAAFQNTHVES
jgi:hypothetical protein